MPPTLEQTRIEVRLLMARYLIAYPEDAALPSDVLRRAVARAVLSRERRRESQPVVRRRRVAA